MDDENEEVLITTTNHELQKEDLLNNKSLSCPHPGCGRTLSRRDRLRNHMKLHSGEKPFACDEPGCCMTYATERGLRRHQKDKHDDDSEGEYGNPDHPKVPQVFECPEEGCTAMFAYHHNVKRHLKLVHSQPPKFLSCTECDAKFKKHNKLKEHMYFHSGEKFFKCEHPGCDKTFSRIAHRKSHQRTHEGYSCDQCVDEEKCKFSSWSELMAHKKEAHRKARERRFQCEEPNCTRAYTRSKYLRHHVAVFHRGERVTCDHCKRTFSTSQKMRNHVDMFHEGENPRPLPTLRKKPEIPRPKKLTPEERLKRLHERMARRLSGFAGGAGKVASEGLPCIESPVKVREGQ